MHRRIRFAIGGALVAASTASVSSALAQDTTIVAPPPPAQPAPVIVNAPPAAVPIAVEPRRDVAVVEESVPNTGLILSGSLMLGLTYGSSVVVAASSNNDADQHLYVPLAGPWIDLADRDGCDDPRGTGCDSETANKVLLVADGIFQAVGAAQIVGGFVFPSKRVVEKSASVRVTPTAGRAGYGLAAFGRF